MKVCNNLTREILSRVIKIESFDYTTIVKVDIMLIVDAFGMDILGMQRLLKKIPHAEYGSAQTLCICYNGHRIFEITKDDYDYLTSNHFVGANGFVQDTRNDIINLWDLAEKFRLQEPEPYSIVLSRQ